MNKYRHTYLSYHYYYTVFYNIVIVNIIYYLDKLNVTAVTDIYSTYS